MTRKLELEKKVSAVGKKKERGGGGRERKRGTNDWIFSRDFSPRSSFHSRRSMDLVPLLSLLPPSFLSFSFLNPSIFFFFSKLR